MMMLTAVALSPITVPPIFAGGSKETSAAAGADAAPRPLFGGGDLVELRQRTAERFFTPDPGAGVERCQDQRQVRSGRRQDVDEIRLFGGEHGCGVGVGVWNAGLRTDGLDARRVLIDRRHQFDTVAQRGDGLQVADDDAAGSDKGDAIA